MLTFDDIYVAVKRECGDQGGIFIDGTDILRWANEGIEDIMRRAELLNVVQGSTTVLSGVQIINLALGYQALYSIEFLKVGDVVLQEVTFNELEFLVPGWTLADPSGVPLYYWVTPSATEYQVNIYPKPNKNMTILWRGSCFPALITILSDQVQNYLPREYIPSLVRFCVARARRRERDNQGANEAMQEYLADVNMRRGEAASRSTAFDVIQPDEMDWTPLPFYTGY